MWTRAVKYPASCLNSDVAVRAQVFAQNMAFIEARNAEDHPYKLGVTAFADLTPEEFSDYLGYRGSTKDTSSRGAGPRVLDTE